jgi:hypothetical protein
MHTTPTQPSPINRLSFANASVLFHWLLANQATWIGVPARLLAERASSELGFKITAHNVNRMRHVVSETVSTGTPE